MKDKILCISLILVIIILGSQLQVLAVTNNDVKINLSFSDTAISDVLRAIAEVADVNLIVDASVQGKTTLKLNNLSFEKSISLITKANNLNYRWDGNTIVIAPPEKLEQIYSEESIKILNLKHVAAELAKSKLTSFFPELKIDLMPETGQLILMGADETLEKAFSFLEKIDIPQPIVEPEPIAPQAPQTTKIYKAKYADTLKLKNYLNQFYPEIVIKTSGEETSLLTIAGDSLDVAQAIKLAEKFDESQYLATRQWQIDYTDLESVQKVISGLLPELNIQVESNLKRLIIAGREPQLDQADRLISILDNPKRQVMIDVRIEEIAVDKTRNVGIDPDELSSFSLVPMNLESGKLFNPNWPDALKLLQNSGNAQTLANPSLMTVEEEDARILIGDEIPIPIQSQGPDGETTVTYEYREVGIILKFNPKISSDDLITLSVNPEVSNIDENFNEPGKPPRIKTRELETLVTLKDGQTFAIGGLIQDDLAKDLREIPFFSQIPLLGELFKSRSKVERKTEIIIFITPHIVNDFSDVIEHKTPKNIRENKVNIEKIDEEKIKEEANVKNEKKEKNQAKEYQELTIEELKKIISN